MSADWMHARVDLVIGKNGAISATVTHIRKGKGKKPGRSEDVRWYNARAFEAIRKRIPGRYRAWCCIGGATAIMVRLGALMTVSTEHMARLKEQFCDWDELVLLETVRNTGAPGGPLLRNVFEPTGGGAGISDLKLARLLETVEMGVYHPSRGWAKFHGKWSAEHHDAVHAEQQRCWKVADKDLPWKFNANLVSLDVGSDTLGGERGLLCVGPVGDMTFVTLVELDLGYATGFQLRDLELSGDGSRILDRKIVAIARREGRSPLLFEFDSDGFDPCGLHMPLGGENMCLLSHLAKAVLGPYGLGWFGA